MTNSRDLILKLKEVKERDKLSLGDIETRTEENGEHVSKTTLSRVFSEGSEDNQFKFESTLKPIANALLDIDTIEEDDDLDTQGLKIMLKYKATKIKELEAELDHAKVKYHEKLEKERAQSRSSIDFLKEQIALKDKRMDMLLEAIFEKDKQQKEMLARFVKCNKCTRD